MEAEGSNTQMGQGPVNPRQAVPGHPDPKLQHFAGQVTAMLQQVTAVITRTEGQGLDAPRRVESEDVALERFQKFRPPKFNGKAGDEAAEHWLDNMGNIFRALGYGDERKVNFAVFN